MFFSSRINNCRRQISDVKYGQYRPPKQRGQRVEGSAQKWNCRKTRSYTTNRRLAKITTRLSTDARTRTDRLCPWKRSVIHVFEIGEMVATKQTRNPFLLRCGNCIAPIRGTIPNDTDVHVHPKAIRPPMGTDSLSNVSSSRRRSSSKHPPPQVAAHIPSALHLWEHSRPISLDTHKPSSWDSTTFTASRTNARPSAEDPGKGVLEVQMYSVGGFRIYTAYI